MKTRYIYPIMTMLACALLYGGASPVLADACPPVDPDQPTAAHLVTADLDYAARTVHVRQQTRYINQTAETLADLVFNAAPNRWAGVMALGEVRAGDTPLDFTLDDTRIAFDLPRALEVGCAAVITLDFTLNLPDATTGPIRRKGYFGHTPRQINLGRWLPTVAPRMDGRWVTHPPVMVGEQDVLEVADWDVTLVLHNSPPDVVVAGPGIGGQVDANHWHFIHEAAREIAFSISAQFNENAALTHDGAVVNAYTLSGTSSMAAAHFLEVAAGSLSIYGNLFTPYPRERLVIVQGDFPDGMEFDGLVFVGDSWFTNWNGEPRSYLTLITVHEVAHQWWYARVGNDSALAPWLDEALATYSEYLYLELAYPQITDWWWHFRVDNLAPQGFVDGTVYEFSNAREYINAVYLRGVRFLHDLRGDLGDDAFFALLRDYAATYDGQIATPDDFWALLTAEQREATAATRARYLRQPDIDG